MRQYQLVPAGAQQWFRTPVAVGPGAEFAYCSGLAVYVHSLYDHRLGCILARLTRNLCGITWSPHAASLLATAAYDNVVRIWDLETETETYSALFGGTISHVDWSLHTASALLVASENSLYAWDYRLNQTQKLITLTLPLTTFRQSPTAASTVALATEDGTIYLLDTQTRAVRKLKLDSPITDIQFDPLSSAYMLVCLKTGQMMLYELEGLTEVSCFAKQPSGVRSAAFVPGAPGTFVVASERAGALQVWNVSQQQPIQVLSTGLTGIQSVTVVPGTACAPGLPHRSPSRLAAALSAAAIVPAGQQAQQAQRGSRVVLSSKDGRVGVYDLDKRMMLWCSDGGSMETIFDCAFRPGDPQTYATVDFDGGAKLWDADTGKCRVSLTGCQGTLYSVTWSPDGALLAASSKEGSIFIMDVAKGKVVTTVAAHTAPSYRVCWHPSNNDLLASVAKDNNCAVFTASGEVKQRLMHPAGLSGVAWSHSLPEALAVSCDDCFVYVYDFAPDRERMVLRRKLAGHTGKVFNVEWSPLLPDVLLSGSDDKTARVWDLGSGTAVQLTGHTANVRGLMWHSELPCVALTGSWDSTVRVWNTHTGACLKVITDHHADIYGISSHPQRPFTVVTSSRDTTVRLWGLSGLFPRLVLRAYLGSDFRGEASNAVGSDMALCGPASAALQAAMKAGDEFARHAALFTFFGTPGPVQQLWDLARIVKTGVCTATGSLPEGALPHCKAVAPSLNAKAQELELARHSKAKGIAATKKDEVLRAAAAVHLQAGNLEAYCDILVSLGEWDKAIAVAPAVSLQFWSGLLRKRIEAAAQESAPVDELAPLYIASNSASSLVDRLTGDGRFDDAFAICATSAGGGFAHLSLSRAAKEATLPGLPSLAGSKAFGSGKEMLPPLKPVGSLLQPLKKILSGILGEFDAVGRAQMCSIRAQQAEAYRQDGDPISAACCHLTVDDTAGAIDKLVRGNEVELAHALAMALGMADCDHLHRLLAAKCEAAVEHGLAASLLRKLPDGDTQVELLAARFRGDEAAVLALYKELGLESTLSGYQAQAEQGGAYDVKGIRCLLLARAYEQAAQRCIACLRTILSTEGWTLADAQPALDAALSCHAERLPRSLRDELTAYCAYVGAFKAGELGFLEVIPFLFATVRRIVRQQPLELPVSLATMAFQEARLVAQAEPSRAQTLAQEALDASGCPAILQEQAASLLKTLKSGAGTPQLSRAVIPAGASIPSGGHRGRSRNSAISGKPLQGPSVSIADGSEISLGEAVMLAQVVPFSPTGSGQRLQVTDC